MSYDYAALTAWLAGVGLIVRVYTCFYPANTPACAITCWAYDRAVICAGVVWYEPGLYVSEHAAHVEQAGWVFVVL